MAYPSKKTSFPPNPIVINILKLQKTILHTQTKMSTFPFTPTNIAKLVSTSTLNMTASLTFFNHIFTVITLFVSKILFQKLSLFGCAVFSMINLMTIWTKFFFTFLTKKFLITKFYYSFITVNIRAQVKVRILFYFKVGAVTFQLILNKYWQLGIKLRVLLESFPAVFLWAKNRLY